MKFIYTISLIALNLCLISAISPTNSTRESLKVEERNKSRELFNATVEFPSVNGTKFVRDLNVTVDEAKVIKKLVEETNITVPVATNVARRLFGAKKPIAVKINREVVAFIENTTNSSATLELKIREEISTFDLKNSTVGLKNVSHEEFKNATIVPVKIVKKESEGNSTLTVRIAVNETLPVVEHSNSTLTTTTVVVPVKERETEFKNVTISTLGSKRLEDGDEDAVEDKKRLIEQRDTFDPDCLGCRT